MTGQPTWITWPLTPGRPEDHPDLVAAVETTIAARDTHGQTGPATVAVALDQQTTTPTTPRTPPPRLLTRPRPVSPGGPWGCWARPRRWSCSPSAGTPQ